MMYKREEMIVPHIQEYVKNHNKQRGPFNKRSNESKKKKKKIDAEIPLNFISHILFIQRKPKEKPVKKLTAMTTF